MNGWKTKLAGAVSLVYGVGGIVAGIHDMSVGMGFVAFGLGCFGLDGKFNKLLETFGGKKPQGPSNG